MTARLILICHGATAATRGSSFPADEPLEESGKRGAAALAERLPKADRWLTGPELRCRQTAAALGHVATVAPLLRDCDYGAWRGRSFKDVYASETDAAALWLRDPAAAPHSGESVLSLMQRVADWLLAERSGASRSIAVTHAAVIRAAITCAIGAPPQSFWRVDIAPLSISCLSSDGQRWNLSYSGCTLPLD